MVAGTVAWAVSYWNAEYNEGVIYQLALIVHENPEILREAMDRAA